MGMAPENRNPVFSVNVKKGRHRALQADIVRAGGKSTDLIATKPRFHSWLSLNMYRAPGKYKE